jgi:hypothetical protein
MVLQTNHHMMHGTYNINIRFHIPSDTFLQFNIRIADVITLHSTLSSTVYDYKINLNISINFIKIHVLAVADTRRLCIALRDEIQKRPLSARLYPTEHVPARNSK